MRTITTALAALCACVLLPGCPSPHPSPGQGPVALIGPAGGIASTGGSSVTVPPGALTSSVIITATSDPGAASPAGVVVVGTPIVFGPEGQQFAAPVIVTLAFDPSLIPAGRTAANVAIYTAPTGSTSYTTLTTQLVDSTHVSAQTSHFSIFLPGVAEFAADGGPGTDGGPTDGGPLDAGPPWADGGCVYNSDCWFNQVCDRGNCVSFPSCSTKTTACPANTTAQDFVVSSCDACPDGSVGQFEEPDDPDAGLTCAGGQAYQCSIDRCVLDCATFIDCPVGFNCISLGGQSGPSNCVPDSLFEGAPLAESGQVCLDGESSKCACNSDCPFDKICQDGSCIDFPTCSADTNDCPSGTQVQFVGFLSCDPCPPGAAQSWGPDDPDAGFVCPSGIGYGCTGNRCMIESEGVASSGCPGGLVSAQEVGLDAGFCLPAFPTFTPSRTALECLGIPDAGVVEVDAGSSGDGGPNQVHGMINGVTLNARGAFSFGYESFVVEIGDIPNFCAAATKNASPPNAVFLDFTFVQTAADGGIVVAGPGTYTVDQTFNPPPSSNIVLPGFFVDDATCNEVQSLSGLASSGTATLTRVAADEPVQGTFDLMFGANHVTGSFDAPPCENANRGTTCQ